MCVCGGGGAWCTIQQRFFSTSSLFCWRSLWAVLAWAGTSTLRRLIHPVFLLSRSRRRPPYQVPWKMGLARLVVTRNMYEPCEFPSLDTCQGNVIFLVWTILMFCRGLTISAEAASGIWNSPQMSAAEAPILALLKRQLNKFSFWIRFFRWWLELGLSGFGSRDRCALSLSLTSCFWHWFLISIVTSILSLSSSSLLS